MIALPQGTWITIRDFPSSVAAEDVQTYFYDSEIDLNLDQISVTPQRGGQYASVIVSLNKLNVLSLVERATHDVRLQGRTLSFLIPEARR
jgi:hypothetical protein